MLEGRIVRDFNKYETKNGSSVANITLAVKRNRPREGFPDTNFINCVAWGFVADNMHKLVGKGNRVNVTGEFNEVEKTSREGFKYKTFELTIDRFSVIDFKNQSEVVENDFATEPEPTFNITADDAPFSEQAPTFSQPEEPRLEIDSDDLPF